MEEERILGENCGGCDCKEGEIHQLWCDMEECPFCGEQLIGCQCVHKIMGTTMGHLSEEQTKEFIRVVDEKGPIPWIDYPNLCGRCGVRWPEMFSVPDKEWGHYIQRSMRNKMLCRECYDHIKKVIDEDIAKQTGAIL